MGENVSIWTGSVCGPLISSLDSEHYVCGHLSLSARWFMLTNQMLMLTCSLCHKLYLTALHQDIIFNIRYKILDIVSIQY